MDDYEKEDHLQTSVGLFGFGCVGQGLYKAIHSSKTSPGVLKSNINIDKVCIKNKHKERIIAPAYLTHNGEDILKNNKHNPIVELINDDTAAYEIIKSSLLKGRNVVSANKKTIAENFSEFYKLQTENNSSLLYEGACAGSIPIIRTLEDYYVNEQIISVRAILNGSTNFILTKMHSENFSYNEALVKAQQLEFAELNPLLDVLGYDSKFKICILSVHSLGAVLNPGDVFNSGIQNIDASDIQFAKSINCRIKLIAYLQEFNERIISFVIPTFISEEDPLFNINNEDNGIELEGKFTEKQLFTGKGSGSYPTGSAVLSDITAISSGYRYSYKKLQNRNNTFKENNKFSYDFTKPNYDFNLKLYIRYSGEKDLDEISIIKIIQKFEQGKTKHIIADVNFRSLLNLPKHTMLNNDI